MPTIKIRANYEGKTSTEIENGCGSSCQGISDVLNAGRELVEETQLPEYMIEDDRDLDLDS